jgi:hypothetical protein
MDHKMVFSYGYCQQQNQQWHQNVSPSLAILMAMVVRRSNTDGIAQRSTSRATPEATGRCLWATTCSVLPQRLPGQQQTKRQQNNGPNLLAILMAATVCQFHTTHIT